MYSLVGGFVHEHVNLLFGMLNPHANGEMIHLDLHIFFEMGGSCNYYSFDF